MTDPRHLPRLELLECGRGLAAFAVVLFHADVSSRIEGWSSHESFALFQYGVDFFFVLSGFIIYHAHARHFGHPNQLGSYTGKRLIRLIPTLWLVTSLTYGLQLTLGMPVDFGQFMASALPYPSLMPTDPAVVWTLRHEFLFYLLIAVAIWSRRWGAIAFGAWLAGAAVQLAAMTLGGGLSGLGSFFFSSYTFDFLIGMGVAALHHRRRFAPTVTPLIIGTILLVPAFWWDIADDTRRLGSSDYTQLSAAWFTVVLGIVFALIVHGLVVLEGRVKAPRALVALGATTYSLYLIHAPINGLLLRLLPSQSPFLASGVGAVILVVAGVAGGFALHHAFEGPVGAWLKARYLARRDRQSRVTGDVPVGSHPQNSTGQG